VLIQTFADAVTSLLTLITPVSDVASRFLHELGLLVIPLILLVASYVAMIRAVTVGLSSATPVGRSASTEVGPDLAGAQLADANLRYRSLTSSSFRGANLAGADLSSATAVGADFTDAMLQGANLSGTNLTGSRLESVAILKAVILDSSSQLDTISWNDIPFTKSAGAKKALDRIAYYHDASRVYRTVALSLRAEGLNRQASFYRLRELRAERAAARLELRLLYWLGSLLLDLVAGYGERPGRILGTYLVVVSSFAAGYWALSNLIRGQGAPLQWYEALVLSLSSFHGRGFFPTTLTLGDPVAMLAACEAVFGLFIELILIATFTRRLLGS
jgi:hypothetical protein